MSDEERSGDEHQPRRLQGESNGTAQKEEKQPTERVVGNPRDVLCGRGFHITNHHGNLQFHLLVNKHRESYRKAQQRKEKQRIIRLVIEETKKTGARFLKRVEDTGGTGLVELDYKKAYEKVSHALRLQRINESYRLDTQDESNRADSRVPTQVAQSEELPQSSSAVVGNPGLSGVVAPQNHFAQPQFSSLLISGLQRIPSIQGMELSRELFLHDQLHRERALHLLSNLQPPHPVHRFNSVAARHSIPGNFYGPSSLQNSRSSTAAPAPAQTRKSGRRFGNGR
eukprot:scaffold9345_cov120-Cylindrotheca_fusiformis.AAC.19